MIIAILQNDLKSLYLSRYNVLESHFKLFLTYIISQIIYRITSIIQVATHQYDHNNAHVYYVNISR